MPYLTVYTNVDFNNSKELVEDSAKLVSIVLGKPINYVVTNFIYNPNRKIIDMIPIFVDKNIPQQLMNAFRFENSYWKY